MEWPKAPRATAMMMLNDQKLMRTWREEDALLRGKEGGRKGGEGGRVRQSDGQGNKIHGKFE